MVMSCIQSVQAQQFSFYNLNLQTEQPSQARSLHVIKQVLRPNKASFFGEKSTQATTGGHGPLATPL